MLSLLNEAPHCINRIWAWLEESCVVPPPPNTPTLWLPSSLSTSTCTDYWSEDRTELSVWCRNGTRDGQQPQTDEPPGHRQGGGLPDAWTLAASGVRQKPVWVFCLDSELLGSSFPVLPHPCQILHGTIKQSGANSYPPELAFLQLVCANHSSEDDPPPRPVFLSLECLTPSGPGTSW